MLQYIHWILIGQAIIDVLLLGICLLFWRGVRKAKTQNKGLEELTATLATLQTKAFQLEKEMEHYRKRVLLQINMLNHICETARQILEKGKGPNTTAKESSPVPPTQSVPLTPLDSFSSPETIPVYEPAPQQSFAPPGNESPYFPPPVPPLESGSEASQAAPSPQPKSDDTNLMNPDDLLRQHLG